MKKIPQEVIDYISKISKEADGKYKAGFVMKEEMLGKIKSVYLVPNKIKKSNEVIQITSLKDSAHLNFIYSQDYTLITDAQVEKNGGLEAVIKKLKSGKLEL
ncbi:MAG: hypothetical protein WCX73_00300 [Candidatus Pacearchaeota archaeon]|jgi:hypothetical protein